VEIHAPKGQKSITVGELKISEAKPAEPWVKPAEQNRLPCTTARLHDSKTARLHDCMTA